MSEATLESALALVMSSDLDTKVSARYARAARMLAAEVQRRIEQDVNPVMPFTGRDEVLLITSRGTVYPMTSDEPPPATHTMTDRDIVVGRSLLTLALNRLDRLEPSP